MGLVKHALALLCIAGAACAPTLDEPRALPELDVPFFRCNVQPVLSARCSFMECHGSARRPLRLFSVQRLRLGVPWDDMARPLSDEEMTANYDRSRGFAGIDEEPALLLSKPLDTLAGGRYHRGQDLYGEEDVFTETSDPGYRLIEAWIAGAQADPDCEMTQEVGP